MIVFQYVTETELLKSYYFAQKYQYCNVLLNREIKFRKTFESASTAKMIRETFFLDYSLVACWISAQP